MKKGLNKEASLQLPPKILVVFLILLSAFPLFISLDYLPVRLFDESRLAVNALEMSRNHNFLVTHYKGEPDMWNVKPPLMIWCQTACIHIFGAGEMALRLPSALAGLLTILLTFYFVMKASGQPVFGLLAALVLTATPGFIAEHGTRSGDYDALLVLFQLTYASCYFLYLKEPAVKKYWYLTCLGVVLAVYTKGIAGLMLMPGLFIYALVSGNFLKLISMRSFWYGVAGIVFSVAAYYGLRETFNPGYLHKVYENEIFYRYFDVNEGHEGPWNFYIDYLINTGFSAWYPFVLAGLATVAVSKELAFRNLILFIAINALAFLFVISYSETKIEWYALPLYPLLAIIAAAFFWSGFRILSDKLQPGLKKFKYAVLLLFTMVFTFNFVMVVKNSMKPVEMAGAENIYSLSYVFQKALRGNEDLHGIYYCYTPYNAHLHFYTEVLNEKGQLITLADQTKLQSGFKVLVGTADVKEYIRSNYQSDVLKTWENGAQLLLIR